MERRDIAQMILTAQRSAGRRSRLLNPQTFWMFLKTPTCQPERFRLRFARAPTGARFVPRSSGKYRTSLAADASIPPLTAKAISSPGHETSSSSAQSAANRPRIAGDGRAFANKTSEARPFQRSVRPRAAGRRPSLVRLARLVAPAQQALSKRDRRRLKSASCGSEWAAQSGSRTATEQGRRQGHEGHSPPTPDARKERGVRAPGGSGGARPLIGVSPSGAHVCRRLRPGLVSRFRDRGRGPKNHISTQAGAAPWPALAAAGVTAALARTRRPSSRPSAIPGLSISAESTAAAAKVAAIEPQNCQGP
jgi:hypothetical protein